jgi:hypothetical protein
MFRCAMATAAEILRRQTMQRAVYARFTSPADARLKGVLGEHAWLLAKHAVDAILDAEASLAVAAAESSQEPAREQGK